MLATSPSVSTRLRSYPAKTVRKFHFNCLWHFALIPDRTGEIQQFTEQAARGRQTKSSNHRTVEGVRSQLSEPHQRRHTSDESIASRRFAVAAQPFMLRDIGASGWKRFPNPEYPNPRMTELCEFPRIALSSDNRSHIGSPVIPLRSLITFGNCKFICVSAFCNRWMQVAGPDTCSARRRQ